VLPAGHNRGNADIPENHLADLGVSQITPDQWQIDAILKLQRQVYDLNRQVAFILSPNFLQEISPREKPDG